MHLLLDLLVCVASLYLEHQLEMPLIHDDTATYMSFIHAHTHQKAEVEGRKGRKGRINDSKQQQ
jgi:hypothetical protein